LGEQGSEDDWLTARDPDGSIRRDLQGLGLLDDGIVDYADSARLLERRLASAGIDVELESFEGGHTSVDKAPAIVDALAATLAGT
jgi:predicted esterase